MNEKIKFYEDLIFKLEEECIYLQEKNRLTSIFRLIIVSAGIFFFYITFQLSIYISIGILILSILTLIFLIKKYITRDKIIKKNKSLIKINKNEIDVLENNNNTLYGNGNQFKQHEHAYTNDLDIFGEKSIFHIINRCKTYIGETKLSNNLKQAANIEEIKARQIAIKELAEKTHWRQDIYQFCEANKIKIQKTDFNTKNLEFFFDKKKIHKKAILLLIKTIPFISIIFILLAIKLNYTPLIILLIFNTGINAYAYKNENKTYQSISNIKDILISYFYILEKFEKESWESQYLKDLQKNISTKKSTASHEIAKLNKLISYFEHRNNIATQLTINIFFLWNLNIFHKIETWLKNNINDTDKWFETIGEIESLSSLANLSFNNEKWSFPEISSKEFEIEAKDIAHPLIKENTRVYNDYVMIGKKKIDIITGSNMAGKSTFLRSLGVNMTLAYCGAPVCATYMKLSIVNILSSMRITDSINNKESSFYAELKKINMILTKLNTNNNYLVLLDEILRGTNSKDKLIGSQALTKQLLRANTNVLIATHDLELAQLENEYPGMIRNKYFDISIENNNLFFSYKINNGICDTFNAPILMKKMGIDLDILNQ